MTDKTSDTAPAGRTHTELPPDPPSTAPMPTQKTVRMRTNLPYQAVRFGAVSLKMMKMVLKSHG
jgi:hypothetical protein